MSKVSQFSSIHSRTPHPPVELMAVLSAIKSGKWQQEVEALRKLRGRAYDEAKKKLPAFTATGVFDRRNDDGFLDHSGVIQVDVDGKDNPDMPYREMWDHVRACPHVYAAFRSPSGRGIKALIKCPPDKEQHAGSYKAAAQWLSSKGIVVDTQVCALSQLCFCSYDPNIHVNAKAVPVTPLPVGKKDHALVEYEETRTRDEILAECERLYPDIFPDLWKGDFDLHTSDHSTADHMLICMLRECCFSNEMVAELFEESGLFRESKYPGRTRDYVFMSIRRSSVVESLNMLPMLPPDPDAEPRKKRKPKGGWAWTTAAEIEEWKPEDDLYIVKRMLYEGTCSCIFGPSGSGKTFVVADIMAAVVNGEPWRGFKTRRGGVMYFGLEGRGGIKKRIQGMKKEGKLTAEGNRLFAKVECSEGALNLMEEEHTGKVVETVKAFEAESGFKCKIVVVDTLARATAGGDENSSKDMGVVLVHAQMIASATGCCVLVVHHTGKQDGKGMRGSSALPAGFDTTFAMFHWPDDEKIRVFTFQKQRDEEKADDKYFRLRKVELGFDEDNEAVTTCVVDWLEGPDIPVKKEKGQKEAEDLMDHIPKEGVDYQTLMDASGMSRSTFQRRLKALEESDFVLRRGERIYPVQEDIEP